MSQILADYPVLGSHSMVALIPARAGSKRCPGKNTRLLGCKPLYQWSIDAAKDCGLFQKIIVSTDELLMSVSPCVEVHKRKSEHATDTAHDFLWVQDVMQDRPEEIFAILRPTSPFRTASTIKRAYAELIASGADSIRAVEPVKQHPGKMWRFEGRLIEPALRGIHMDTLTPWHSSPTQTLPPFYVQNASMEMAWSNVLPMGTISGHRIAALLTDPVEGFDINTEADFAEAERMALKMVRPVLQV